jgi:hypothetical protein
VTSPHLTGIKIKPAANGARVFHLFDSGKPKQFLFTNPKLMTAHIKRAVGNEWLNPISGPQAEAGKVDRALNL